MADTSDLYTGNRFIFAHANKVQFYKEFQHLDSSLRLNTIKVKVNLSLATVLPDGREIQEGVPWEFFFIQAEEKLPQKPVNVWKKAEEAEHNEEWFFFPRKCLQMKKKKTEIGKNIFFEKYDSMAEEDYCLGLIDFEQEKIFCRKCGFKIKFEDLLEHMFFPDNIFKILKPLKEKVEKNEIDLDKINRYWAYIIANRMAKFLQTSEEEKKLEEIDLDEDEDESEDDKEEPKTVPSPVEKETRSFSNMNNLRKLILDNGFDFFYIKKLAEDHSNLYKQSLELYWKLPQKLRFPDRDKRMRDFQEQFSNLSQYERIERVIFSIVYPDEKFDINKPDIQKGIRKIEESIEFYKDYNKEQWNKIQDSLSENNTIDNNNFEREVETNRKIRAKSGLMVQSKGEQSIADFLSEKNIDFEYDKQITLKGNQTNSHGYEKSWVRPDFYLTEFNIAIEYWGLKGTPDYDEKMEEKKRLYIESKTPFISIEPGQLGQLEELLTVKLKRLGVNF